MLTPLYLSKKRNTEKQTKLFAVTDEIKLGVIEILEIFEILHIHWHICSIN